MSEIIATAEGVEPPTKANPPPATSDLVWNINVCAVKPPKTLDVL